MRRAAGDDFPLGAALPADDGPVRVALVTGRVTKAWRIDDIDAVIGTPGWRGWLYRWCLRRLARFGSVLS